MARRILSEEGLLVGKFKKFNLKILRMLEALMLSNWGFPFFQRVCIP